MHQGEVVPIGSTEERELLLSGLVVKQQGFLRVTNPIYESIFNRSWVEQHTAIALSVPKDVLCQ